MASVLVVMSDGDRALPLLEAFANDGFAVELVPTPQAALASARSRGFGCVLVDSAAATDGARSAGWWRDRSSDSRAALCLLENLGARIVAETGPATNATTQSHGDGFDLILFPELGMDHLLRGVRLAIERRQLHRDYHELEKLALLGTVSAGVLHELKNPLNNVLGGMERFLSLVDAQPAARRWATMIRRNGQLLRDSLSDLLSGFREEQAFAPVEIHSLLDRALTYVFKGETAYRAIALERAYLPEGPVVPGAPGQLLHLFLNLLVNARQSLDKQKGTVTVRTSWESSEPRPRAGRYLQIDVEDTGPGIAPELLDRLFESFRTTKATGSGFGLLLCRKIVERHGGTISAANLVPVGARFRVRLPVASKLETMGAEDADPTLAP